MRATRGTIVVAGAVAQRPRHAGHTWVFLQYLLGFRELGWDVLLLDWIDAGLLTDDRGRPCSPAASVQVATFLDLLVRYDLAGSLTIHVPDGDRVVGLGRQAVLERVRQAALLLNVMGYLRDEEILAAASRRVFLDIDPGYAQIWRELGLFDAFAGHDAFVTIGANVGQPDCRVPTCGLSWITTPPPVVLSAWPFDPTPGPRGLTSVVTWRSHYGTVSYQGETFGPRAHEMRRLMTLPGQTGQTFELALDIDPSDSRDRDDLLANGWRLIDPRAVANTLSAYQQYVRESSGEIMVAQNMYVQTRSGWFSDRSVCYLASGRPVLAQDTGIQDRYASDAGLLLYATLEEAIVGARALSDDPPRQARAARAVAEEYFDAQRVLARLLGSLGVG